MLCVFQASNLQFVEDVAETVRIKEFTQDDRNN